MFESEYKYLPASIKHPLLSAEDERGYLNIMLNGSSEAEKIEARNQLVLHNQRLVLNIAKHYRGSLPLEDAIQEGNIGLLVALNHFDIEKSNRLSTYAIWWIRQTINRTIDNYGDIVRQPVYHKDWLRKIRKVREHFIRFNGREPTRQELAEAIGISTERLEQILSYEKEMVYLDTVIGDSKKDVYDYVPDSRNVDPADIVSDKVFEEQLEQLISEKLSKREKEIVVSRLGIGGDIETLQAIGESHKISKARVGQIFKDAMIKLKKSPKIKELFMPQVFKRQQNALKMLLELEPPVVIDIQEWSEKTGYKVNPQNIRMGGFAQLLRNLAKNNAVKYKGWYRNKCEILQIDKITLNDILSDRASAVSCKGNLVEEVSIKAASAVGELHKTASVGGELTALCAGVLNAPINGSVDEHEAQTYDDFKPLATLEMDGWELVDDKGDKWVRGKELNFHLGYIDSSGVAKIYERHQNFFIDGKDTTTVKLTAVDGRERETRVFSFTGGLKICRYSEMPKADEVMQQLIDIGDKVRQGKYPAMVFQLDDHIAKWQEALVGNVLLPKFVQIEDTINAKADKDEVEKLQVEANMLRDENLKLRNQIGSQNTRLLEHEKQFNDEMDKRKVSRLRNKIGGLARIDIALNDVKYQQYWAQYRDKYGYKLEQTPWEEGLKALHDIAKHIKVYVEQYPVSLHKLSEYDKMTLITEGVYGNLIGIE